MLVNLQRKCCDCPCSLSTENNKIFSLCPQLCDIDDVLKGYFYIDKELECGCEDPFLTYQFECVDCSYCNEEQEVEVVTLCPCGDPDYGFPCCKDLGFAPPELSTDTTTDSSITQINPYVYPRPENTYNVYDTDENLIKTCVNKNCTFYIENGVLVYSSLINEPKIQKCGCCCMLTDTQGNRIVAEPKCPKLCPNANEDPTNIEDYVYYVNSDYECCQGILKAGCYSQCEDGSLPKNYCKCCDEENGETWGPCCGPGGPEPETEDGGEEDWPGQNLGCPNCWWSNACGGYYNICQYPNPYDNSVCVKNDLNDDANFACRLPDGSCPSGYELQSNNVIFCSTNPEFQEGNCQCIAIALTQWGCFSECEECQQFTTCEEFANYVFSCTNTPPEEVNLKYECPLSPPCDGWPENCNQGE